VSDFELLGGTQEIDTLSRAVARMGRTEWKRDLLASLADAALDLVRQEFAMSRDPYGNPWAPLKKRRAGGPVLVKSGRMQGRIRRRTSSVGFTLVSPVPYSGFHQSGTRRMVQRRIFPDADLIPPEWTRLFERIAEEAVAKALLASL
jgi:phage gpG-like protein